MGFGTRKLHSSMDTRLEENLGGVGLMEGVSDWGRNCWEFFPAQLSPAWGPLLGHLVPSAHSLGAGPPQGCLAGPNGLVCASVAQRLGGILETPARPVRTRDGETMRRLWEEGDRRGSRGLGAWELGCWGSTQGGGDPEISLGASG